MIAKYRKIWAIIIMVSYCFFLGLAFCAVYTNGLFIAMKNMATDTLQERIGQYFVICLIFPLALLAFILIKRKSLRSIGLEKACPKAAFCFGAVYVILFLTFGEKTPTGLYLWLYYLLCIAFSEEVVFRGIGFFWIYNAYDKSMRGAIEGCVVSGLIWGISHAIVPAIMDQTPFLEIALSEIGGGILGSAFYSFALTKSHTLLVPIFIHASLDYLSIIS